DPDGLVDHLPREPAVARAPAEPVLVRPLRELGNAVGVQLFKHVPWIGAQWARRHRFVEASRVAWAPVVKRGMEAAIGVVTTADVHLASDPAFDMDDEDGDPSVREIPSDVDPGLLTITHRYYDHRAADRDINVVLPLERLRELVDQGRVGAMAPRAFSL